MGRDDGSDNLLTPGRLYFVQLLGGFSSQLPARFTARLISQQLHREAPGSDQLVRHFTFALCGADGGQAREIALPRQAFHAEPLSAPAGVVIHVDFSQRRQREQAPLIRAVV
jgi:hypothetical protein